MNTRTAKELLRKIMFSLRLNTPFNWIRERRGQNLRHLRAANRKEAFTMIYDAGIWLNEQNAESRSGSGSTLANTESIRKALPEIVSKLRIKRLIDVGCGDWNWMKRTAMDCEYIGIDIVSSVIEQNRKLYGGERVKFMTLDAVAEPLPEADCILCREMLFHLSFEDARKFLANVSRLAPKYILITSDDGTKINADITTGDFRLLNLRRKPFSFPAPLMSIEDGAVARSRRLFVYEWVRIANSSSAPTKTPAASAS